MRKCTADNTPDFRSSSALDTKRASLRGIAPVALARRLSRRIASCTSVCRTDRRVVLLPLDQALGASVDGWPLWSSATPSRRWPIESVRSRWLGHIYLHELSFLRCERLGHQGAAPRCGGPHRRLTS